MSYVAWFGLATGSAMVGMWTYLLVTSGVPEVETAPVALAFHLVAEGTAALGLIVSSVALLRRDSWAPSGFAFFAGMLLYSVLNSPGYYAQQGEWPVAFLFGVLAVLTVASVAVLHGAPRRRAAAGRRSENALGRSS